MEYPNNSILIKSLSIFHKKTYNLIVLLSDIAALSRRKFEYTQRNYLRIFYVIRNGLAINN